MIGMLPKTLLVGGVKQPIDSDYRTALKVFVACDDVELLDSEKMEVMLKLIYNDFESISPNDYQEAIEQAVWFLDGGSILDKAKEQQKKVIDWEQDENYIFSAINKVANNEVRAVDYMHLWTFLGYFCEMGEGMLQNILNIRIKKNKGKPLDKAEQEFYRDNQELIDIREKYTEEEEKERDRLREILGIKGE